MDSFDKITCEEYEALFPMEQEYQLWMAALEADYMEECNRLSSIATLADRSNFHYISDELSPFATVNS